MRWNRAVRLGLTSGLIAVVLMGSSCSKRVPEASERDGVSVVAKNEFVTMLGARPLLDSTMRSGSRSRAQILEPGDEVAIAIYDKLPVSQEKRIEMKRVDDDGTVFIIPAGKVQIMDLTPSEAEKAIEKALAPYVVSPFSEVTITKRANEPRVYVFGEVGTNGTLDLRQGDRLLDVLARAGGVTLNAYRRSIKIVRLNGSNVEMMSIDLHGILSGSKIEGNIALQDQDIVFVPRHFLTNLRDVSSVLGTVLPWYYYVRNLTL